MSVVARMGMVHLLLGTVSMVEVCMTRSWFL